MTELASNRRMASLVEKLEQDPTLADQLPAMEGDMVRAALNGEMVYEIAQRHAVTEGAVWDVLSRVVRASSGQGVEPVITGGNLDEPSFVEDEEGEAEDKTEGAAE